MHPYRRIVEAAKVGKGVRLSAEEVAWIAHDDAIETHAENVRIMDEIGPHKFEAGSQSFWCKHCGQTADHDIHHLPLDYQPR